jgi:hypothetical protein
MRKNFALFVGALSFCLFLARDVKAGSFTTAVLGAQQAQVAAKIQELQRDADNLRDFVRNPDGSVRQMNQYDADTYCKSQGTRLPTVRELALYCQSLGAKGISATERDGYYLVRGSDSVGNPDSFYFSNEGYQRPTGDFGNYWFWSSSVDSNYSYYAYYVRSHFGGIYAGIRSYDYNRGVRCVRSVGSTAVAR